MTRTTAPPAHHRVDDVEVVILLDEDGRATGTVPKSEVHHADTPLHLAFSAYVLDDGGRLLLTRRALHKRTFPGVWTNSVCGHPAPGEELAEAATRRARQELGLELEGVRLVLPRFRYRAEMDGVVENEMCPVLVARVGRAEVSADPDEVEEHRWVSWSDLLGSVLDRTQVVSPWCSDQVRQLHALGPDPAHWPTADPAMLPAALR